MNVRTRRRIPVAVSVAAVAVLVALFAIPGESHQAIASTQVAERGPQVVVGAFYDPYADTALIYAPPSDSEIF